ncbi:MAG: ATP-binding cassette domain-containing protein [Peptococcaceae bacterium]|nr:ATP-binding cassette domain-containing protein [Peptococcaceae bacterium]
MSDTIVKTSNLCLQSGKRFLLRDINWEVKRGDHWLIFGMNGSGKTTLLSMVAGFKCPTSGYLEVFGQPYTNENVFSLRRRIGWVSSSFFDVYYNKEPALDIVLSGLFGTFGVRGCVSDQDIRLAKHLLRELRLGGKINMPFYLMSKGERQNVLIARALITRPDILVLDEPSMGLDIYAREYLLNTVRALAEEQAVTILYVTHYPEDIQPFMNKTLLLRHGQVFAQGDTREMMTSLQLSDFMQEQITVHGDAQGCLRMSVEAPTNIPALCYSQTKVRERV